MAIGKAGAYATVEGPKVDFGDIALNAQKIQQADLDRAKSMIPEKQKEKEVSPYEAQVSSSGVQAYDYTMQNLVKKTVDVINEAKKNGDNATYSRADMAIKTYKNSTEIAKEGSKYFTDKLRKGEISGLDKDKIENVLALNDKNNVVAEVSDQGEVFFSFVGKEKNEDGTLKPKKVRFGDRYVDKINADDIANFMTDILPPVNILEESKQLASTTGANKTSVENGTLTVEKTEYSKENLKLLRESISSKIKSDTKYFEDVWYQSNPSKNNVRKLPSEYTEEDYKQAEDFLYKQTRRNFDTSYSQSYDEPKDNGNGNGDGDKDSPYLSPKVSVKQKKIKGVTSNYGYEIPVIQKTDKVKFGGVPVQIKSTGYDKDSKRFYIAYSVSTSESESSKLKPDPKDKTSTGGNKNISTKGSSVRYVWLNGEGANVTNGEILASNIKDLNGVNYNSVDDLITDIKTKDPRGMFFSNNNQSKTKAVKGGKVR